MGKQYDTQRITVMQTHIRANPTECRHEAKAADGFGCSQEAFRSVGLRSTITTRIRKSLARIISKINSQKQSQTSIEKLLKWKLL